MAKTQRAVKIVAQGVVQVESDVRIPQMDKDSILVKIKAVAINPADWKHVWLIPAVGSTLGLDYAGVVEQVGDEVVRFTKGDRVCGWVHGGNLHNLDTGAFAEYAVAKSFIAAKIPDSMPFEAACTLGVGITTLAQGMYQNLGLAFPWSPTTDKTPMLIYGGGSATGSLSIQFAKMSGYTVITTASAQNHEMLKSIGADHVLNYRNTDVGAEIRRLTDDNLHLAWDCVGEVETAEICAQAMSSTGGTYASIAQSKSPRNDIITVPFSWAYSVFGEIFTKIGPAITPRPEDREFASNFWSHVSPLLELERIKTHPYKVVDGGLSTISQSVQAVKDGKARGFKLVHIVS